MNFQGCTPGYPASHLIPIQTGPPIPFRWKKWHSLERNQWPTLQRKAWTSLLRNGWPTLQRNQWPVCSGICIIDQVDSIDLSLNTLLENGLAAAPQGPKKLDGKLLEYINTHFTDNNQNDIYPEMINENEPVYEGLKKEITVNKYERSSIARAKCIEYQGLRCKICNTDFSEVYGAIGKGFIHIHHITPVSKIGETYKVDYKKDLIPVCPNCHAMLHKRKENGEEITIEELQRIYKENKK